MAERLVNPQYYRLINPDTCLRFRVKLRRVYGESVNVAPGSPRSARFGRSSSTGGGADTMVTEVQWQEKLVGPREMLRGGGAPAASIQNRRAASSGSGAFEVGVAGDAMSEIMVYTYVDRDQFNPAGNYTYSAGSSHIAGSNGSRSSMPQPRDQLHSGRAQPQVAAHPAALADSCTAFHIMAAVDINLAGAHVGVLDMTEQVLCQVHFFSNGCLEVKPGFSAEQPEVGDEGAFPSDHTVHVADKTGARLSTYRFTSRRGNVFEYSIENLAAGMVESKDAEVWILRQTIADGKRVLGHKQGAGLHLCDTPSVPFSKRTYMVVELVSAEGDLSSRCCAVEFELVTPPSWAPQQGVGGGWRFYEDGRHVLCGNTHAAHGAVVWKPSTTCTGMHMCATPLKGLSVLLGLVLLLCLVFGGESAYLMVLGMVLMCVAFAGMGHHSTASVESLHFGHPIELDLMQGSHQQLGAPLMYGTPQLFVKLNSTHAFGRRTVAGYGHSLLPCELGSHQIAIRTWRPWPRLRMQLWDYHLGGASSLKGNPGPASAQSMLHAAGKYGFRTETAAVLHVRVQVATQGFLPSQSQFSDTASVARVVAAPLADVAKATASVPNLVLRMREQLERSKARQLPML